MIPGFSRNWRRTSSTTAPPARPTASMESAANRQTIRPPTMRPMRTAGLSMPKVMMWPLLAWTSSLNPANRTIAATELPGAEDAEHDDERGQRRGLQALREALDDVRRVARLRRAGRALDRREARRRVVVGDDEQQGRHADPDQRAQVELAPGGRA